MSDLLMHVIRYVMPSKNKELKKLLYFYWEVCPKRDTQGALRHEMILVCNSIQHDLQHPNEYIRGNTLRFVAKLREPELLEPLVPAMRTCLGHRHAYVRKNAVFAVYAVNCVADHLIPDAADLLNDFLQVETDPTCKRNAFVCLSRLQREYALLFLQSIVQEPSHDPLLQMAIFEFMRHDAAVAPELRPQYLDIVTDLVETATGAVAFEAVTTLTTLSSSHTAILTGASKLVHLAIKESDNNVKLIALEKVGALNRRAPGVLDDLCLEILRAVSSQDVTVRACALNLGLELVSARNVDSVVKVLKKELEKTVQDKEDQSGEYRAALIGAIRSCAVRFEEVVVDVVGLLVDLVPSLDSASASQAVALVKEVIDRFPKVRSSLLMQLLPALNSISSGKVYRGCLWIVGEYSIEERDVQEAWRAIKTSFGEEEKPSEETLSEAHDTKPVVLPDGTYATESATVAPRATKPTHGTLRALLKEGDFYLGSVLSSTLVKLVFRMSQLTENKSLVNALKAEAMMIMVSVLKVGNLSKKKIDEDTSERIMTCIHLLGSKEIDPTVAEAFLQETKVAFENQLCLEDKKKAAEENKLLQQRAQLPDDPLIFRQLEKDLIENPDATDTETSFKSSTSQLDKIVPLTGFSDPVYAEASIQVHQFDVVLDVLVVNQTTETLRNLSVEFATLGDLKVVDKPSTTNVGPHGFHKVTTTIKVTSADTGVIFGNIVYEGHHSDKSTIVILSDVHVDIMDYIKPASCSEVSFRKMWNEFEWENKITIKSKLSSLESFLQSVLKETNMKCLTPGAVGGEECQFLSANLYAKSSFGEDALANLCIEKKNGGITGHVRIRSKGQGLALSMGDKVAATTKKPLCT